VFFVLLEHGERFLPDDLLKAPRTHDFGIRLMPHDPVFDLPARRDLQPIFKYAIVAQPPKFAGEFETVLGGNESCA
jgi:hypothetical protein